MSLKFNLLRESWIPVIRAERGKSTSTRRDHIRPAELTSSLNSEPVIAIDWPRADFRLAQLEFLIGLLSLSMPPKDQDQWREWWEAPPAPDRLDTLLEPYERAFNLDGHRPRFLQDFDVLEGEENPITALLIDAPGANAVRNNSDLFVKRGRVAQLSRSAAAIALYTLQAFAPSGGAGHRTSMRGGGPMTTLVLPGPSGAEDVSSLWDLVWLNMPEGTAADPERLELACPWLAPTRTSEKGKVTTPSDVHPAQQFFGMPRRIRLAIKDNDDGIPCGLTDTVDPIAVTGFVTRPHGISYSAFRHPLTPYYKTKASDLAPLPVHPKPAPVGYRHWLGLLFQTADERRLPAQVIAPAGRRLLGVTGGQPSKPALLAAGYAMDNMKPLAFIESELPIILAENWDEAGHIAEMHIGAAETVRNMLHRAVRSALYAERAEPDHGSSIFDGLRTAFWEQTEPDFYRAFRRALGASDEFAQDDAARSWLADLRRAALRLFDATVDLDAIEESDTERIVVARRNLSWGLAGIGAAGQELFKKLKLRAPEKAKPKAGARRGERMEAVT